MQSKPYSIRMPEDLIARLKEKSKESGRSFNAEVVHRLEQYDIVVDKHQSLYQKTVMLKSTLSGLLALMRIKGLVEKDEEDKFYNEKTFDLAEDMLESTMWTGKAKIH
jgi:hypothetical protein